MDTVKLIKDFHGLKAGTELTYDKDRDLWFFDLVEEDISDDIVYTKSSKIYVSDARIDNYPHLFKRSNSFKKEAKEIMNKYGAMLKEMQEELIKLKEKYNG